jgi:hypothetical protein
MARRFCSLLLAAAMVGPVVAPLYAQSLADIARKEEERRKAIKEPAKVYTNDDVGGPKPGTLSSAPESPSAEGAKDGRDSKDAKESAKDSKDGKDSKDAKDSKDDKKSDAADPTKDAAYWRGKMQALQAQLEHDQGYADALQVKINALTTDFVNRDDPAQKMAIQRDRDKALAELDRLKKSVVDDKKAITDLEEDARRAGVPPGWLR